MAQRISTISGVAQVLVYGSQKYAVRIQVDPRPLATRGIGIDEVATAIQGAQRRTCRPARCTGRTRLHGRGERAAHRRRRPTGRSSSPTATARRCGSSELGKRHRQRRERQDRGLVLHEQAASARSCSRSSGSRARTRSRSPAPSGSSCRTSASSFPASVEPGRPLRPLRVDPRVRQRRAASPSC